ncbi:hypothetical protein FIBSPDRAFT_1043885 [Athelia psychrophila]|uniref:Uncharacterized protein n=1 Tax=Athelia psychrophila TaxID=1759441 RepID=A0A166KIY3_9AGAM|nr:hypothetical protein FIBSPDRAFT_1043885 [Fibularhizoctonia sp. CBS 109695]
MAPDGAFLINQGGHVHGGMMQPLRGSGDHPQAVNPAPAQTMHYISSDPSQAHPNFRQGMPQQPITSHHHVQHHQLSNPTSAAPAESHSTSAHAKPPPLMTRFPRSYEPSQQNAIASLPSPSPSSASRRESIDHVALSREHYTQSPLGYTSNTTHPSHYDTRGSHSEPILVHPHSAARRPSDSQIPPHSQFHASQGFPTNPVQPVQPLQNDGHHHNQQTGNQMHGPPFDRAFHSRQLGHMPQPAGQPVPNQSQLHQAHRASLNDPSSQSSHGPPPTSNPQLFQQRPQPPPNHVTRDPNHPSHAQPFQLASHREEAPPMSHLPPQSEHRPPPQSRPMDPMDQVGSLLQQHAAPLIMGAWNRIHTDMRTVVSSLVASHQTALSAQVARTKALEASVKSYAAEIQCQAERIQELEGRRRALKARLRETQDDLAVAQQERDIGREELGKHWEENQGLHRQLAIAHSGSNAAMEGESREGDEVERLRDQVRELIITMNQQTRRTAMPTGDTEKEKVLAQTMKTAMASRGFQRGVAAVLASAHQEIQATMWKPSVEGDHNSELVSSISAPHYDTARSSDEDVASGRDTTSLVVDGYQDSEMRLLRREDEHHFVHKGRPEKRRYANMGELPDGGDGERATKRNRLDLPAEIPVWVKDEEVEVVFNERGADDAPKSAGILKETTLSEPPTSDAKGGEEGPTTCTREQTPERPLSEPLDGTCVEEESSQGMQVDQEERAGEEDGRDRSPPTRQASSASLPMASASEVSGACMNIDDDKEEGELPEEGEVPLKDRISPRCAGPEFAEPTSVGWVSSSSHVEAVAAPHASASLGRSHAGTPVQRERSASASSVHCAVSSTSGRAQSATSATSWLALPSSSRVPAHSTSNPSFESGPLINRLTSPPVRGPSGPTFVPYYPSHAAPPYSSIPASSARSQANANMRGRPRAASLFKPSSIPVAPAYTVEERLIPFVFHTTPRKYVCTFCASRYKNADPQTVWPPIPTFPIPGTSTSKLLAHCQKSHSSPCEHLAKMTDDELRQRKDKIVIGLEREKPFS